MSIRTWFYITEKNEEHIEKLKNSKRGLDFSRYMNCLIEEDRIKDRERSK